MITNSAETEKIGLYVHIPFCIKKCVYCDFLSVGGASEAMKKAYTAALTGETAAKGRLYEDRTVDTIFIGGGTPSALSNEDIAAVLEKIGECFKVDAAAEITVEANPGTLSFDKLQAYRRLGINRLSLGVQSFDDGLLRRLGRIHTAGEAVKNFKEARRAGFDNVNMDLMFAIPDHTREAWRNTLRQAIAMEPEHISFYSLQLEEGTPLFAQFESGSFKPVSDEDDRYMYHEAVRALKAAGYEHYEISNAAKPGRRCRHNLKYWSMSGYLGLGAGAHSFMDGRRLANTSDIEAYTASAGAAEYEDVHINSLHDSAGEFMFTGLRRLEGISLAEFEDRFSRSFFDFYRSETEAVEKYIREGFLVSEGDCLRLTEKGIDISNAIFSIFV